MEVFRQVEVRDASKMAGALGFEPSQTDPESVVLPLDDAPANKSILQ